MKLSCDAVICDINRNWYFGRLIGFKFNIIKKLNTKDDIRGVHSYNSVAKFIQSCGYRKDFKRLTRTLMKNITIFEWIPVSGKDYPFKEFEMGKGVTRLFLSNAKTNAFKMNFLCENCDWTCKQPRTMEIFSCKAFKN